ncbi:MAG TPA: restriction endonuclease subunit S [Aquimonas sp.]|nr:restriction endonuclease subunit S [Aquimonas sp.]HRF54661.1 restriction endonuclease subunit S [Aquimonas sp.]
MSVVPKGWARTSLGAVATFEMGQAPPGAASNFEGIGTPFVKAGEFGDIRPVIREWTKQPLKFGKAGDVFICVVGATAGKLNLGVDCSIGRSVAAIRPAFPTLQKFLYYQLLPRVYEMRAASSGSAQGVISQKDLSDLTVEIAPEAQQTRIVEKLEELLSDLDAGVAELKAAQKKLAQYRQSLLKAAVEGALTAEWRAARSVGAATTTASFPRKRESSTLPGAIASDMDSRLRGNDGNGETGDQLLQRILTERRARWEAKQLAKFKEQGKTPPKDWQKKYPEPVRPDTSGLPELPQGWVWASLDMLGDIASGVAKGTKTDGKTPTREVPYLRVANVQRGYLDLSEVKTIQATKRDIQELALVNGDVLFNEGGDRDKLGRGWVWRSEISECIHQNHVFRMRPFLVDIQPELISHQGNTFGKLWFQNAGKQTTNLASINMGMLRAFPVPVAPADEQVEILEQIRTQLESLAQQERATDLAMKQSIAQRQNILRAAFAGQLVPQDPADEPASVLLERIRAERATQAAGKNHGGARRRNPHNKAFDQAKLEFIPANIGSTS